MQICREEDTAYMMSTSLPTKYLTTEDENSASLPLVIEKVNFVSVIKPEITQINELLPKLEFEA